MKNGEMRQLSPADRPPQYIERDIEETRARMGATLDSLESQLSQGQIVDRALAIFRSRQGKDIAKSAGKIVLHNPIGFGLIGAGIGYMAYSAKKRKDEAERQEERRRTLRIEHVHMGTPPLGYANASNMGAGQPAAAEGEGWREKAGEKASDLKERAEEKASEWKGRAEETAHGIKEQAEEKAHEAQSRFSRWTSKASSKASNAVRAGHDGAGGVKGRTSEMMGGAREKASGIAEGARQRASDIAESARMRADDVSRSMRTATARVQANSRAMAQKAKAQASHTQERVSRQFHERPLLFVGLGLAIGAAIAATLPPTRREDRVVGRHRDRLLEKVDETSAHGIDRAREAAARAAQAIEEEVRRGDGIDAELGSSGGAGASGSEPGDEQMPPPRRTQMPE